MIPVFNVAPIPISVRFDGQDINLAPGPGQLPGVAISYGKNQNPIMGSVDPDNPHLSGGRYLLQVVGQDPCVPMTDEEWDDHLGRPCRIDERAMFEERYANDPKAKQIVHGGKSRKAAAKSRYEAGGTPAGIATFEADK